MDVATPNRHKGNNGIATDERCFLRDPCARCYKRDGLGATTQLQECSVGGESRFREDLRPEAEE
jgi:hypothetical protein